jgi:uncharacterized protein (DUF1684 family)
MVHFAPENGTYVYFRFNQKEKVMVAFNKNDHEVTLDGSRFIEITAPSAQGRDLVSGKVLDLNEINIPARSVIIIEI